MFLYNLLELTFSFLANQIEWDWKKEIIIIIIHSKICLHFWLAKSHAQFIITSYCWPKLEEFCDMRTDVVSHVENCQIIEQLTEKT